MNLKVNLISKSRKTSKNKNLIVVIFTGIFSAITLSFLIVSGYVVIKIYLLNKELTKVSQDMLNVSSEIRSNNSNVNKYVLAKGILDYVYEIDKKKFHYKKYMDEIVSVLPEGLVLKSVDFQLKGWVSVTVAIPDMLSLRSFEDRITDKTIIDQTVFSTVYSEGITKDKFGGYSIKLQFQLKDNV